MVDSWSKKQVAKRLKEMRYDLDMTQESVYCILKIPKIAEGIPESCMRNFPIIADVFGISLNLHPLMCF